jgi:hypothetical protein
LLEVDLLVTFVVDWVDELVAGLAVVLEAGIVVVVCVKGGFV